MAYEVTQWENEVPDTTPLKYKITGDVEGELSASATIELVTPVTTGTPVNASNLNKIEQGIADAHEQLGVFPARASRDTAQSAIPSGTATLIQFATETFDPGGAFTTGASARYTAPADGYYQVNGFLSIDITNTAVNTQASMRLYKNGVEYSNLDRLFLGGGGDTSVYYLAGSDIVALDEDDYIDIRIYQNSGNAAEVNEAHVSVFRLPG